jgi:hypothetical protein
MSQRLVKARGGARLRSHASMSCLLWYVLEPMSALRSRQKRRGGSTDWSPVWYEKVSNDQNQSRGHDRTWRSCFHRFIVVVAVCGELAVAVGLLESLRVLGLAFYATDISEVKRTKLWSHGCT